MNKTLVISILLLIVTSACISQDPGEIHLHSDECTYCKMVVSDMQFASQIVSSKGKSYPFDSIECMAAYHYQNPELADDSKSYVRDYTGQDQWILLDNADIYYAESVKSPMGLSLFAIHNQEPVPTHLDSTELMKWDEAIGYVVNKWSVQQ